MKKLMLLFAVIGIIANLNAQDIVIRKTGDEIKAKITEVGLDNVKYKKFDNLEGSDYIIPRDEIFMIKYENGNNDTLTKSEYLRKGLHLGFHITPGAGTFQMYNYTYGLGINLGVDLSIYSNDNVGVKTGISYLYIPIDFYFYNYEHHNDPPFDKYNEVNGLVSSLGIPIKFLLTTGNQVGFYLESGLNIYYPILYKLDDHLVYQQGFMGNIFFLQKQ